MTELRAAARAMSAHRRARRRLIRALADAHRAGHSYRAIGERVGLSHERVRQMALSDQRGTDSLLRAINEED